jgi:hypothetical protein
MRTVLTLLMILATAAAPCPAPEAQAIKPFTIAVPEASLADPRDRLAKSRADLRAGHERSMRQVRSIMGEHYRALNRVLTPEECVIFKHMVEAKKASALKQP